MLFVHWGKSHVRSVLHADLVKIAQPCHSSLVNIDQKRKWLISERFSAILPQLYPNDLPSMNFGMSL
jgi:hypothetical protein